MHSLDLTEAPSVRCGDGIVALDFATDRYSCRYDPIEHEMLAEAEPLAPAWRDATGASDRLEHGDAWLFVRAWCAALVSFSGKPVRDLMTAALRLERAEPCRDGRSTQELAACFERMSLYLPYRAPCLLRAYALLHFLAFYGRTADWVIGVQLFPFRAHCWLANDDLLVGERVHLIEDYVPLFRLRTH